jgi:hypothetical protein
MMVMLEKEGEPSTSLIHAIGTNRETDTEFRALAFFSITKKVVHREDQTSEVI